MFCQNRKLQKIFEILQKLSYKKSKKLLRKK